MKQMFEPSVDPWDLMVEHNQRIQRLEQQHQQLAQLGERLSEANLMNVKSIEALSRAHEQNLRLVMDLTGRLNIAQEK